MKKKTIQRYLFLFLLMTSISSVNAQEERILSKDEACADLDSLIYTISEVHPNMFAACNQGDLFNLVDEAKKNMPDNVSSIELYKRIAPIVTKIGDGHTNLWFPYNDYFTKDTQRMPLFMKVTGDKGILVESCIDDKIPHGAEIVEINGVSSKQMIEQMLRYAGGEKEFYRIEQVNNNMKALFELLFKADSYQVVYRNVGSNKTQTIKLNTTALDELKARMPHRQQARQKAPYSFSIDMDKSTAVMDFRSFQDSKAMTHFADSMF
ncbi:MAG: hypothetical protein ACOYJG_04590 [Prevotella sp.]